MFMRTYGRSSKGSGLASVFLLVTWVQKRRLETRVISAHKIRRAHPDSRAQQAAHTANHSSALPAFGFFHNFFMF